MGNRLLERRNQFHYDINKTERDLSGLFRRCHGALVDILFQALQLGKISQVAPIDKLSVALAIIFSVFFLGETLTLKTAIGAICIIAGTIIIIL